ncbi:MAG TPA: catalase family peroxidase [Terracidiphilus sp.]|nr:catalase family peroxidase [Terracidiphilus sp.]
MPLPQDERVVVLAREFVEQFHKMFGPHPGFRPAHAKGLLLTGKFKPAANAQTLTKAPHIARESTPVTARFSNSTGIPFISDNVPEANPRGLAIRFNMAEHVHTDIVAHSTDGFPTRDGKEFLEFLKAAAASGPDVASPKPIENFLATHPSAKAFVQAPKPFASSLARNTYFGVTAFKFSNDAGQTKFGRYRIVPESGNDFLTDAQVKGLSDNYHFDEIVERVVKGPIRFKLLVQIAAPEDKSDDATIHWPETRELFELGTIELTGVLLDNSAEQQHIIFDPIPRVEGIEPSDDPLLELRAAVYLISGRERRAAKSESPAE